MKIKSEKGTVTAAKGEKLDAAKLFELPVDILVPGARPDVIHKGNVANVKAKIVAEGGNLPAKYDIEQVLMKKGVVVLPDFVANAGGVISSYCETMGWDSKTMFQVVESKISTNTKIMLEKAQHNDTQGGGTRASPRSACAKRWTCAAGSGNDFIFYLIFIPSAG